MLAGVMRWPRTALVLSLLVLAALHQWIRPAQAQSSPQQVYGYAGFATYYGIEDGVVAGDVMYDGTPYDPADPTIAAASFLFPLHTWLRVCQPARCIIVQVRDRGLLDQNSVLIDLSRAAYRLLFGQLGGKAWVSAYYSDPYTLGVDSSPVVTDPLPGPYLSTPAPAAPAAAAPPAPAAVSASQPTSAPPPAPPTPAPAPNRISVPGH
jgi:rare lipoprotein A (peptidoglycan hydrolase)